MVRGAHGTACFDAERVRSVSCSDHGCWWLPLPWLVGPSSSNASRQPCKIHQITSPREANLAHPPDSSSVARPLQLPQLWGCKLDKGEGAAPSVVRSISHGSAGFSITSAVSHQPSRIEHCICVPSRKFMFTGCACKHSAMRRFLHDCNAFFPSTRCSLRRQRANKAAWQPTEG